METAEEETVTMWPGLCDRDGSGRGPVHVLSATDILVNQSCGNLIGGNKV